MGCPQPNGPFPIFTGDVKTLPLRVAYASGLPVDLTSCTEIVVNIQNADGTFSQFKLSLAKVVIVDPPVLGQFTVAIDAVASAKFQIGELQSFDVTLTIGTDVLTVRFYQALSVFEAG